MNQINKPKPKHLAMIICDATINDRTTNKKSLIGLFDSILTDKFPCHHQQLNVFVSLTDGIGDYTGKLRCIDEGGKTMVELSGPIKFPERLMVTELNFEINGLIFPKPGIYSFELYCDDELICRRKFVVKRRGEQ